MNGKFDLAWIDSVTSHMHRDYHAQKKKKTYDDYRNYSLEIMSFIEWASLQGFQTTLILSHSGVGKTTMLETLIDSPYEPIIYHLDAKELPSISLKKRYGTRNKPTKQLWFYNDLEEVKKSLSEAKRKGLLDPFFTIFMTAHLSRKVRVDDPRERMKVVGAMTDKAEVESWLNDVAILRHSSDGRVLEWEKDDTSPAKRQKGLFEGRTQTAPDLKLIMDEYQDKLREFFI